MTHATTAYVVSLEDPGSNRRPLLLNTSIIHHGKLSVTLLVWLIIYLNFDDETLANDGRNSDDLPVMMNMIYYEYIIVFKFKGIEGCRWTYCCHIIWIERSKLQLISWKKYQTHQKQIESNVWHANMCALLNRYLFDLKGRDRHRRYFEARFLDC